MSGKTNDDTNGHPNPNLPVPKSRRTIRGSSKTEDTNEGKTSTIRRPSGRPPPRSNTNTTIGSPKSKRRPPPRPHDPPPRTNSSSDASDSSPTKGRLPPPGRGPKGFEQTSSPKSNGRPPVGRRRRPPNGPPQRKGPPVSTSTSEIIQFAQKHAQRIQSRPRYKPPTNPPPPTGQTKGKGGSPTKRRGSSNGNNSGGDKPPPPTGPPPKQRRSPTKSPTKLAPDPRRRPSGPPPGKGRNVEWEEKYHNVPHYVYLAISSAVKVGITNGQNLPYRWIDQGASSGIILAEVPYRRLAGDIEVALKEKFTDKTNWRKMLTNDILEGVDLEEVKWELEETLPSDLSQYLSENDDITEINYPVLKYPTKVTSVNLEKIPKFRKKLMGIKGQYFIFDDNTVINIRWINLSLI